MEHIGIVVGAGNIQRQGMVQAAGGKPALLIELPVVGQIGLGDHRHDLAFLDGHGAVIELSGAAQGHAEHRQDLQVAGGFQDSPQALHSPFQQGVVQKQVAAGIAGKAQFRQGQDLYALLVRLPDHGEDLLGVVPAIRHPDLRGSCRHADKAVFHGKASSTCKNDCLGLLYPGKGENASRPPPF